MSALKRKSANLLLIGGGALLALGGVLFLPRLAPYVETILYTRRIPTAPPFEAVPLAVEPTFLLPSDTGEAPVAEPSETPTAPSATANTATTELLATPTPEPMPVLTATPTVAFSGTAPVSLSIPSIDLDAPVVPIGWKLETVQGQSQAVWDVPDTHAAGWHDTSMLIGMPGNTVLNGHNTSNGEVFRDLYKVEIGARIFVDGKDGEVYVYRVQGKYILREAGQPLSVRLENARYIQETPDERITLVTCHPYGSLAKRLVLIAYPVNEAVSERGGAN